MKEGAESLEAGPAGGAEGLPQKGGASRAWLPMVLPLVTFVLANYLEGEVVDRGGRGWYAWSYAVKLFVVGGVTFFCMGYWGHFKRTVSVWGVATGLLGFVVWVGLCELGLESRILGLMPESLQAWFGGEGRVGFNPREELGNFPLGYFLFLAVRFLGLVVLVPVIEEVFVRGFLVPFMEDPDWWRVKVGAGGVVSFLSASVYGAATHPGEWIAAGVWFSLISWLARRTGSLGDCVAAHAITNFALGVYVMVWGRWQYW